MSASNAKQKNKEATKLTTSGVGGREQKQKLRKVAVAMKRAGETSLRALGLKFTGKAKAAAANWGIHATFCIMDPCDAS